MMTKKVKYNSLNSKIKLARKIKFNMSIRHYIYSLTNTLTFVQLILFLIYRLLHLQSA